MDPDDVPLPKFNEFSTFYTFEDLKRRAKALDHWNDLVKRSKALDGDTTLDVVITKAEYKAAVAKATAERHCAAEEAKQAANEVSRERAQQNAQEWQDAGYTNQHLHATRGSSHPIEETAADRTAAVEQPQRQEGQEEASSSSHNAKNAKKTNE